MADVETQSSFEEKVDIADLVLFSKSIQEEVDEINSIRTKQEHLDEEKKPVCFLCQDYKVNVSHETSSCPNRECKKCGQKGHFRWDCMVDDESLIQTEVCIEKEIKSENCIKKEIKTENCIKKEIKTENVTSDEFSKEEENSLMYCLESTFCLMDEKQSALLEVIITFDFYND